MRCKKYPVLDMLWSYDADILATQEALEFQAKFITDALDEYRRFGRERNQDGGREYMAILYRPGTVRPIEGGDLWPSASADVPGSRRWDASVPWMVTWAQFQYLPTGIHFTLHNTRFDRSGGKAREERAHLILPTLLVLVSQSQEFGRAAGIPL